MALLRRIIHLTILSDLQRIQNDAALGNSPLWFGEWGLSTQFNATDDFLYKWADAQKWAYSKGAGWIVSMIVFVQPKWYLLNTNT